LVDKFIDFLKNFNDKNLMWIRIIQVSCIVKKKTFESDGKNLSSSLQKNYEGQQTLAPFNVKLLLLTKMRILTIHMYVM